MGTPYKTAEVRTWHPQKVEVSVGVLDTGKHLLDAVCRALPVRESWFFGLQYFDRQDRPCFLKNGKHVTSCAAGKFGTPFSFRLRALFFPLNMKQLNEVMTVELFFYEIKNQILKEHITCPANWYVPLAALAAQAEFLTGELPDYYRIMPDKVKQRLDIVGDLREPVLVQLARLRSMMKSLTREKAMREYLKLAQTLPMFGVHYYRMKDMINRAYLWVGVRAQGISLCDQHDKTSVIVTFSWDSISQCQYRKGAFVIEFVDQSLHDVLLLNPNIAISKQLKWLCNSYKEFLRTTYEEPDILVKRICEQVHREAVMRRQF